ncbi:unnamed protein product [Pieris macdunnoughi]|uniref:Regulatory protein zeste n=1 Tax=Pieris macdunnoughi TaxID=345717 RepID=A0A821V5G1_9NEOP|nr:unnamed protein product [Pieris macdunnoughi]CAF4900358.1 unnamed protein product [Pieris macdunnoughi]
MEYEIAKGKPLTKEECKFLIDLIEASKIITTKTTNASNNKLKNEEWVKLTAHFNAWTTTGRRTPQQLRLKWENLKKNSRKRCTKIRMNLIKTGGGPAEFIPPDDILDRVTGMLGSTASGFTVPFGGDREIHGLDGGVLMGGDGKTSGDGDATVAVDLTEVVEYMPMSTDHEIKIVVCDGEGGGEGVGESGGKGCVIKETASSNVKPRRFTLGTTRTASCVEPGHRATTFINLKSASQIAWTLKEK